MVEAAQRTPVSLLQMMCNQKELTAEYELISVEGVSHEPTFTYKLKVKDILVTAAGLSKKKAKHSAAKSALDQLLADKGSNTDNFIFEDVTITAENINDFLLEPVSEPVPQKSDPKNAVSILQEFCARNSEKSKCSDKCKIQNKVKFSCPYYETVNECGLPHDKIFVQRCIVIRYEYNVEKELEQFVTLAEGKTKKNAKRDAADLMLLKLEKYKDLPVHEDDCPKKPKEVNDDSLNMDFNAKELQQTEDDKTVPYLASADTCKSDESQQDESNENVTSVPCLESVSPMVESNVSGLFSHEDSGKDSDSGVKLEELRTGVKEIHIDSDQNSDAFCQ